jgi:hypothetical protein
VLTIFQAYARNEIAADLQYRGKSFTIGGAVRSISSGAVPTVELDCSVADKILFIRARFTNPNGLENYKAGAPISLHGTVAGLEGYALVIRNCSLAR